MNSFDKYIDNHKKDYSQIEDFPLTLKRTLDLYSDRNNKSNFISSSSINNQSSILFLNRSSTNKNHTKFLYNSNILDNPDLSKKNLEYDIQIAALKKKLSSLKEQRKQSEMKVNLMKLRIKQLQKEEKESIKELENTKKSIQKIKNNRKKAEKKDIYKTFSKKNKKKHNLIKIKTLSFVNNKNSDNIINNSYFKDNGNKIISHNSFHISMKKNHNFKNNFTPKANYFSNKRILNNSTNRSNISNDNYGLYSIRNTSINLDKINISYNNVNNVNNVNKNKVISNLVSNNNNNNNKNINNKNNKIGLKNQIKKDLVDKLKKDEEERKKIQEEIRKIEKEQYNLWINFNDNMNNGNLISDNYINNNLKININKDLNENNKDIIEDQDNILNYNFI